MNKKTVIIYMNGGWVDSVTQKGLCRGPPQTAMPLHWLDIMAEMRAVPSWCLACFPLVNPTAERYFWYPHGRITLRMEYLSRFVLSSLG